MRLHLRRVFPRGMTFRCSIGEGDTGKDERLVVEGESERERPTARVQDGTRRNYRPTVLTCFRSHVKFRPMSNSCRSEPQQKLQLASRHFEQHRWKLDRLP